jgi:hypothetical protein
MRLRHRRGRQPRRRTAAKRKDLREVPTRISNPIRHLKLFGNRKSMGERFIYFLKAALFETARLKQSNGDPVQCHRALSRIAEALIDRKHLLAPNAQRFVIFAALKMNIRDLADAYGARADTAEALIDLRYVFAGISSSETGPLQPSPSPSRRPPGFDWRSGRGISVDGLLNPNHAA